MAIRFLKKFGCSKKKLLWQIDSYHSGPSNQSIVDYNLQKGQKLVVKLLPERYFDGTWESSSWSPNIWRWGGEWSQSKDYIHHATQSIKHTARIKKNVIICILAWHVCWSKIWRGKWIFSCNFSEWSSPWAFGVGDFPSICCWILFDVSILSW